MGIAVSQLDPFIIRSISDCAWDIDIANARGACKRLRRAVCVPMKYTPKRLFRVGAKYGAIGLCKRAIKLDKTDKVWLPRSYYIRKYGNTAYENWVRSVVGHDEDIYAQDFYVAARGGREKWCLEHFDGSEEYRIALLGGFARNGHKDMMLRAPGFILPDGSPHCKDCVEQIMEQGACGGHEEICILAKQWGCRAYDKMAHYACVFGRAALIEKAMQWDKLDLNDMLDYAISPFTDLSCAISIFLKGGRLARCTFPKVLCNKYFYELLGLRDGFVDRNNSLLFEILFSNPDDVVLNLAAQYKTAAGKHYITEGYFWDNVLKMAVWSSKYHQSRICHLAKSNGATCFQEVLDKVTACISDSEIANLMREWIGPYKQ